MFTTALAAITKLPEGKLQDKLNDTAMTALYQTLPHPPATFVGPQFAFRAADGSGNNPHMPELGKAGLPYARSVQGKHPSPPNSLPDPGLVFDTLLKARDVSDFFDFFVCQHQLIKLGCHKVPTSSWSQFFSDIRLCFTRHSLYLPNGSSRLDEEQYILLFGSIATVWI